MSKNATLHFHPWVLQVPEGQRKATTCRASYDELFHSSFQSASLQRRVGGGLGLPPALGDNTETPPGAPQAGMETRPQRRLDLGCSQIRRSSSAFKKTTQQPKVKLSLVSCVSNQLSTELEGHRWLGHSLM